MAQNSFLSSPVRSSHPPPQELISTHSLLPLQVWCDHTTNGGGWTVILSRMEQPQQEDFSKNWAEYKTGFGDPAAEHWIGKSSSCWRSYSFTGILNILVPLTVKASCHSSSANQFFFLFFAYRIRFSYSVLRHLYFFLLSLSFPSLTSHVYL